MVHPASLTAGGNNFFSETKPLQTNSFNLSDFVFAVSHMETYNLMSCEKLLTGKSFLEGRPTHVQY